MHGRRKGHGDQHRPGAWFRHALLFGEDQARYVITVPAQYGNFVCASAEGSAIAFRRLGTVKGDALVIDELVSLPVEELRTAHEMWFPRFMAAAGGDNQSA